MRTELCAILTGCLLLAGCGWKSEATEARGTGTEAAAPSGRVVLPAGSPKLDHIRVAPVSMGLFVLGEVTAPSKVEFNPNRVSHVLMPVGGRIREVLAHLGDSVSAGQPLISIESPDAAAALAAYTQAQAQVRQGQSAVLKSERDLSRVRLLNEHGAVALKDVQSAENDGVQAQANLEQAQAGTAAALQRLKMLGMDPNGTASEVFARAPIAGKVVDIAVSPGEYRNDTSATLMTVADLSTVWLTAQVPETQIRNIQLGEAVQAEFAAYPGEVFHARVMRIAETVDPQTRTIKVDAEVPNPSGRLRPEMFGQIHHLHAPSSAPAVPVSAVLQLGGGSVVWVEESRGVFQERPVVLGERSNDLMPVISGLSAGERIVVDGVTLLRNQEAGQ
jgi:cobalt-zinc-cadmium efflux system membrane fusion protein